MGDRVIEYLASQDAAYLARKDAAWADWKFYTEERNRLREELRLAETRVVACARVYERIENEGKPNDMLKGMSEL